MAVRRSLKTITKQRVTQIPIDIYKTKYAINSIYSLNMIKAKITTGKLIYLMIWVGRPYVIIIFFLYAVTEPYTAIVDAFLKYIFQELPNASDMNRFMPPIYTLIRIEVILTIIHKNDIIKEYAADV